MLDNRMYKQRSQRIQVLINKVKHQIYLLLLGKTGDPSQWNKFPRDVQDRLRFNTLKKRQWRFEDAFWEN